MALFIIALVTAMKPLRCTDGAGDGAGDGDGGMAQTLGSAKGQRFPSGGKSEYVPLQFTLNEGDVCE